MERRNVAQNDPIKQGEHSIPEDRLRSSSVSSRSSNFSVEDSYQLDVNEQGGFALGHDQPEPTSDVTNNNATATPRSRTSTLETPPVQVMERPSDASAYRIPSYVFARDKVSNPNPEWSIASNDSLFSIHTGNTSFSRDQFSSLLKSGELSTYTPGDARKSGELPPPSPKITLKPEQMPVNLPKSGEKIPQTPSDTSKSGEQIIGNHFKASTASGPAENRSVAYPDLTVKTKQDDIPVTKSGRSSMSDEVPPSTSVSHQSDTSIQSFAFPVLAEVEREKSVNSGQSRTEQQKKSSKVADQNSTPKTPTSTSAPATTASWFSCFSCCSCC
ncbi:hypothetical protein vseg_003017 [Gypsophila vaccaria]